MKSDIAHKIKHRKFANDEFYTPRELAQRLVDMLSPSLGDRDSIMDNAARGNDVFYRCFPTWIPRRRSFHKDFLKMDNKQSWFVTNPPYSFLDEWIRHSCEMAKKGFAYLLGFNNITPRRIEMCEKMGFYITKINILS